MYSPHPAPHPNNSRGKATECELCCVSANNIDIQSARAEVQVEELLASPTLNMCGFVAFPHTPPHSKGSEINEANDGNYHQQRVYSGSAFSLPEPVCHFPSSQWLPLIMCEVEFVLRVNLPITIATKTDAVRRNGMAWLVWVSGVCMAHNRIYATWNERKLLWHSELRY